jgi:transcription initiation factor TFIID subunit 8
MTEPDPSDPFRHCLKVAVSALCTEVGFETAEATSVETLTEITQSLLVELGRSARAFCELAGRVEPVSADIVLALVEMGIHVSGIKEYALRSNRATVQAPAQTVAAKQTAILHTGNKKRHPPYVPDYLPEMPDSHSYIRTPTHRQPVTDYESVREKAASQKRDVERALTRFIAKTGKIHNLFNTDDNIFPLISCEPKEEEGVRLPPYLDALLFKDQVFEEDEREYLPKKRKASNSQDLLSDDEDGPSPPGDKKGKLNESMMEGDSIDNPFLRPVRMPRTTLKSTK